MKNFNVHILGAILLITLFGFSSCSSDDDDNSFISDFDYPAETLYGTWKITKIGSWSIYFYTSETTTATFKSDGTYKGKGLFGSGTGTYTASGSNINCYIDDNLYCSYNIISLEGDTATLYMTIYKSSNTYKLTCVKQ